MNVGCIAAIIDDKDDQAIGPDHAQCQHQNQHRLNCLCYSNVNDKVVARVSRMRATWVLHSGRHEQWASLQVHCKAARYVSWESISQVNNIDF